MKRWICFKFEDNTIIEKQNIFANKFDKPIYEENQIN